MTVPDTGGAPEQHGVAVVTIDHGERNLLNPEVMAELRQGLLDADRDAAVTGILLTGAGAGFCGGLDVGAIQAGADPREFATALVELLEIFPRLTTPVAAYVNGDAVPPARPWWPPVTTRPRSTACRSAPTR